MQHRLVSAPFPTLERWLCAEIVTRAHAHGLRERLPLISWAGLAGLRLESLLQQAGCPATAIRRYRLGSFAGGIVRTHAPVPAGAADALLRTVALRLPEGYFSPVLDRPGLCAAIVHTLGELTRGGFAQSAGHPALAASAAAMCDDPAKLAHLDRLLPAYRTELERRCLDEPALLATAAERIAAGAATLPPRLCLYAPDALSTLDRRLLAACALHADLTVLLPDDGTRACRVLAATREFFLSLGCAAVEITAAPTTSSRLAAVRTRWLAGSSGDVAAAPADPDDDDRSLAIVAAPGAIWEVRESVRTIVQAAERGVPLNRLAILYRDASYRDLVAEVLRAAAVPFYLPAGLPLAQVPVGRAALLLLRLIGPERRRTEVMDLFLSAPLRWQALLPEIAAGAVAPRIVAWDRLSREAGISGGGAEWQQRLRAHAARLVERTAPRDEDAEPRPPSPDGEHLAALQDTVSMLFGMLDALAQSGDWQERIDRFDALLGALLRPGDLLDRLRAAVRGLEALAGLEPDATLAAFQTAAGAAIDAARLPVGAYDAGVFVGDLDAARGLSFRVVCLLGLAERGFPAAPSHDPILDERERRAINAAGSGRVAVEADEDGREELRFSMLLHAASERLVLSYPYMDGDGRERLPSYFLLRLAEALLGRPVDESQLRATPGYRRISPARLAPDSPAQALTEHEYDLATVQAALKAVQAGAAGQEPAAAARLGYLDRLAPDFPHARALAEARDHAREFTAFDGVFAGDQARARLAARHGPRPALAPTSIEAYNVCPQRFFLANVLRLREQAEPQDVQQLRAAQRGSMIHAIFEQFYRGLSEADALPLRPEQAATCRERLHVLATAVFARWQALGFTGVPLLWEMDQEAIREDLDGWLREEIAAVADGLTPYLFEVAFGREAPAGGTPLSPVEYTLPDGRGLRFSGLIDRVDRSADGRRFRIVDYKTGRRVENKDANALRGGRALQLPVYLLAAASLAGLAPDAEGEAQYCFTSRRESFARVTFAAPALAERRQDFDRILAAALDGMTQGRFFPHPGKSAANCRSCDFTAVCDGNVARLSSRKQGSPAAQAFIALQEIV